MKTPIPIKPGVIHAGQPDPLVVALLEKYLEQAKNGQVVSVAIALSYSDSSATDWAGSREAVTILGAVSLLHHRLAAAVHSWSLEFN